jgi:hypothetical protein
MTGLIAFLGAIVAQLLAPLTGWKAICFPASEILGRGGYRLT